jgi:hypothetical protein
VAEDLSNDLMRRMRSSDFKTDHEENRAGRVPPDLAAG